MKLRFWAGLFLSLALALATFVPLGVSHAGSAGAQLLAPSAYKTEKGSASGSASAMGAQDQSGTADKSSAYVVFKTPGTIYRGYLTYKLPSGVKASGLTSLQVLANFKGSPGVKQTWTWKLYNWTNGNWVALGSNTTTNKGAWASFSFGATNVSRFFSGQGELRLQLGSADSSGDGKVDYAVVKIVPASGGNPTPAVTRVASPTAAPTKTAGPVSTASPTALPTNTPPATAAPRPSATPPAVAPTAASTCASLNAAFEARLLELINKARTDSGLAALRSQSQLTAAARGHSADMACKGFTAHTDPDGTTSKQRIEKQGYKWSWAGENIAWGFGSADQVFELWMSDAPHKDNILGANYTEVGVGYAYWNKSSSGHYWTVDFARPK